MPSQSDWVAVETALPPAGQAVELMDNEGHIRIGTLFGRLWRFEQSGTGRPIEYWRVKE